MTWITAALGLFNAGIAARRIEAGPLGLGSLSHPDLVDNLHLVLERRVVDHLGQWATLLAELVDDLERVGRQLLGLPWVSEILRLCTRICRGLASSWSESSCCFLSHLLADERVHSVLEGRIVDHLRHWRARFTEVFDNLLRLSIQDFGLPRIGELRLRDSISRYTAIIHLDPVVDLHFVCKRRIADVLGERPALGSQVLDDSDGLDVQDFLARNRELLLD